METQYSQLDKKTPDPQFTMIAIDHKPTNHEKQTYVDNFVDTPIGPYQAKIQTLETLPQGQTVEHHLYNSLEKKATDNDLDGIYYVPMIFQNEIIPDDKSGEEFIVDFIDRHSKKAQPLSFLINNYHDGASNVQHHDQSGYEEAIPIKQSEAITARLLEQHRKGLIGKQTVEAMSYGGIREFHTTTTNLLTAATYLLDTDQDHQEYIEKATKIIVQKNIENTSNQPAGAFFLKHVSNNTSLLHKRIAVDMCLARVAPDILSEMNKNEDTKDETKDTGETNKKSGDDEEYIHAITTLQQTSELYNQINIISAAITPDTTSLALKIAIKAIMEGPDKITGKAVTTSAIKVTQLSDLKTFVKGLLENEKNAYNNRAAGIGSMWVRLQEQMTDVLELLATDEKKSTYQDIMSSFKAQLPPMHFYGGTNDSIADPTLVREALDNPVLKPFYGDDKRFHRIENGNHNLITGTPDSGQIASMNPVDKDAPCYLWK